MKNEAGFFEQTAKERDKWKKKNRYYHRQIERLLDFLIPKNASVLEAGCSTGDILASLARPNSKGIDFSPEMIRLAREKYPHLAFEVQDIENLVLTEKYDYLILSDVIGFLNDVVIALQNLRKASHCQSRLIITYQNYLWEPLVKLAEWLRLKARQPRQSWLNDADIENFLYLAGWEIIKKGELLLFPKYFPLLAVFFNRFLAHLPLLRRLCLVKYIMARPQAQAKSQDLKVSVVVPTRNEKDNIEPAVKRLAVLPLDMEIIFVEGHSRDNTLQEIKRVKEKYPKANIKVLVQDGKGKGDAVRKGFEAASGEILMILDADLTVKPEELPKFYQALKQGRGDFISGSRLVYPLEKKSMRFLNILGNKFFSMMFSWLLSQRIKDTLCGIKVLWKSDYQRIKEGRGFFGDFDPFGDFDLLFGAAKLNLKITELPIRYQERVYGATNIQRFKHGWLLLKMCFFAMRKIKFI